MLQNDHEWNRIQKYLGDQCFQLYMCALLLHVCHLKGVHYNCMMLFCMCADCDGFEFHIVSLDNKQWHFEAQSIEVSAIQ